MEKEIFLEKFAGIIAPGTSDIMRIQMSSDPVSREGRHPLSPNDLGDVCFYRVARLSFEEDYPRREAFANVLMALDSAAFNFVYILTGKPSGVTLDIGVARNEEENLAALGKKLNASNYGETLKNIFCGNFGGSILERLRGDDLSRALFDQTDVYKNGGVIVGVPSADERDGRDAGFQGIDRLINSMSGMNWRVVVICKRVGEREIAALMDRVYKIYDELAPFARQSMQISQGKGKNASKNVSNSHTHGDSYTENSSRGHSSGKTSGSSDYSRSSGENYSSGESRGTSESETRGESDTTGSSESWNQSLNMERMQKDIQDTLKYIDEELLARLRSGLSRGLFETSIYYMGGTPAEANRLRAALLSLFQGHKSTHSPLRSQTIDLDGAWGKAARGYQCCDIKVIDPPSRTDAILALASRPYAPSRRLMGAGTYLTSDEVSLMAGMPLRETPGLPVRESVEFGLNFETPKSRPLHLGSLIQNGRVLNLPVKISRDALNKHTFIAGVTGSGKTTTCHKLLKEAETPFLVIEPAKTEYRAFLRVSDSDFKNLCIFTLGNETVAPLRLNPFELASGESISAHIDMLKAAFVSAFPMEASMPQILEEAIYKCYEDKGWDIYTGANILDETEGRQKADYPILEEFLRALEDIVETKGFDSRLRDDYRGSLISRFSNLVKGSKGALLNCRRSTNFEELIEKNVVIEMENLKSSEDKALIMGFILSRLSAIIQKKHRENPYFRHLTLIEEAHRLLSRPAYGDNGAKRASVETFTDMLAEIRKYGEGLIIVDQIPNKLAPEALKNTNTKIIHRLFATDDKDAVGDMMLMDKKQREYLSALPTGEAIVFSENMGKPLNVKILAATDTSGLDVEDEEIRANFENNFPQESARLAREREIRFLTRRLLSRLRPLARAVKAVKDISAFPRENEEWREWLKAVRETSQNNPDIGESLWASLAREWAKIIKPPFPGEEFIERATEFVLALRDGDLAKAKEEKKFQTLFRYIN